MERIDYLIMYLEFMTSVIDRKILPDNIENARRINRALVALEDELGIKDVPTDRNLPG